MNLPKVTIPAMTAFIKEDLGEEGVALQKDFLDAIQAVQGKTELLKRLQLQGKERRVNSVSIVIGSFILEQVMCARQED